MATEAKHGKPIYDLTKQTITWTFRTMAALTLDMAKVSEENRTRASYVGFGQVRVKDAAAIGRADAKGNLIADDIRERMQHERMAAIIAHLESGSVEWNIKAGPRVIKGPDYALIRDGLLKVGMADAKVSAMDDATLQRMSTVKKVAEAMALIAAERIVPVVDSEEEFARLLGE